MHKDDFFIVGFVLSLAVFFIALGLALALRKSHDQYLTNNGNVVTVTQAKKFCANDGKILTQMVYDDNVLKTRAYVYCK